MILVLWVYIDMIITLYKNCRLNKSYCEVLDTIAPHTYNGVEYANSLEAYLSTLPKKVFNTGVGTIYGTNSGKIPFELAQGEGLTMYDYNYMKIADETNNFVRYCFILSLQVADGSAIAEYEEDVWASYSATMHVRKSLLTRSRALKYGNKTIPFYKLGMEYEGNDEIKGVPVETSDFSEQNIGKCMIVAQIQIYKLVQGASGASEKSDVITRTVWVYSEENRQGTTINKYYFEVNQALTKYLTTLVANQSSKKFIFTNDYKQEYNIYTSGDLYFEISNFTLIPQSFGIEMYLNNNNSAKYMGYVDQLVFDPNDNIKFADLTRCSILLSQSGTVQQFDTFANGYGIQLTDFEIKNDFTNLGIGTFSSMHEIISNGSDINGSIMGFCDDYNFNVILSFQNQLINITQDFLIDVPIAVQSADVTQQNKTARELEKMNAGLQVGHGGVQLFQSGIQFATSGAMTALGAMTGQVGTITNGVSGIGSSIGSLYSGISNLAKGIKNLQILNSPLFRTNKGTFTRSVGIGNSYYGLILYKIQPDNTSEVQANIDNGGYVVNEVVDDLLQDMAVANDKPAYNVMQFDYINNYGAFPEDIRQRLVDILTNGFKIWYNTAEYIAS